MVACGSSPIIGAAGIVLDLDQRYQRGPLFVLNEVRKVSFDLYGLDSTD
jgi:hypothetical protein